MTFGSIIRDARRRAGLSQKDVAARVMKLDGTPISAPYLNDLEHDRRNPPSAYLLDQFTRILDLPADYLCYLAGCYPADLRDASQQPERVEAAFRAFRDALRRP